VVIDKTSLNDYNKTTIKLGVGDKVIWEKVEVSPR